jgi:alpha-N-arabinofuranosidase
LNVDISASAGRVGFANSGYWGIDVKVQRYTGSFYVKGSYKGVFRVSLRSLTGKGELAGVDIPSTSSPDQWTQHNFTLVPTMAASDIKNSFEITFNTAVSITVIFILLMTTDYVYQGVTDNSLDFNLISLFPPTYRNRPNGLRPDLMQVLAEMKPV